MERLRGEAIVLMYHHVAKPPAKSRAARPMRGLYVTPAQFSWQMEWLLRQGVKFITCRDLLSGSAAAPQPRVIVTFDDGHLDVYEQGFPVLRRLGIPAVVFPVVGDMGKSAVVWPEATDGTPACLLTAGQAREMAAAGIEFGSHLWDHVHADRLDRDELRRQLTQSRERLADVLGAPPVSLAYPYGCFTDQVLEETARAGYRIGLTTNTGFNADRPLLLLRRVAVKGTRWHHRWRFARQMRQLLTPVRESAASDGSPRGPGRSAL